VTVTATVTVTVTVTATVMVTVTVAVTVTATVTVTVTATVTGHVLEILPATDQTKSSLKNFHTMSLSNCKFHENRCWEASLNLAAQNVLFDIPPALHIFRTVRTVDILRSRVSSQKQTQ
jgi:hypothetical protein